MKSLQSQLKAIADKRGNNGSMGDVVKKSLFRVATAAESKSPVDKGLFKGNWRVAFGSSNKQVNNYVDKNALNEIRVELGTMKMGEIVFITNPSSYATFLELGGSEQAPNGMVRITARTFPEIVKDEIRKAR